MLDLRQPDWIAQADLVYSSTGRPATYCTQLPLAAFKRFQQRQVAALCISHSAAACRQAKKAKNGKRGEFHFHKLLNRKP